MLPVSTVLPAGRKWHFTRVSRAEPSLGFWEQGNEIIYFKGTRDNFRINLRKQAIFLQCKGTLTKYFREQWNLLSGKRLSLFIVVNAIIKCIIVCVTM